MRKNTSSFKGERKLVRGESASASYNKGMGNQNSNRVGSKAVSNQKRQESINSSKDIQVKKPPPTRG